MVMLFIEQTHLIHRGQTIQRLSLSVEDRTLVSIEQWPLEGTEMTRKNLGGRLPRGGIYLGETVIAPG